MKSLHWLPVAFRIKFKLCLLMHAVVNGQCPAYIDDIVTPTSTFSGRANSRSTAMRVYDVPRVRTKFGERAFSVAGPKEWNALPLALRNIVETPSFRRGLKSHLFKLAYDT